MIATLRGVPTVKATGMSVHIMFPRVKKILKMMDEYNISDHWPPAGISGADAIVQEQEKVFERICPNVNGLLNFFLYNKWIIREIFKEGE